MTVNNKKSTGIFGQTKRREIRKCIINELKMNNYTEAEIERLVDKKEEEILFASRKCEPLPITWI